MRTTTLGSYGPPSPPLAAAAAPRRPSPPPPLAAAAAAAPPANEDEHCHFPPSGPATNAEDQAEAQALQEAGLANAAADADTEGEGGESSASAALDAFSAVLISEDDTYKYVLIKAKDPATNAYKFLVRGKSGADYHKDAAR